MSLRGLGVCLLLHDKVKIIQKGDHHHHHVHTTTNWVTWAASSPPRDHHERICAFSTSTHACKKVSIFEKTSDVRRVIDRQHKFTGWIPMMSVRASSWLRTGSLIELSVKQEKHSTRTLSLVIHNRVRFKNNLQKKYISIQRRCGGRGMKLKKPSILVVN
jgi:pullulanase/glycogen debranching enzyme